MSDLPENFADAPQSITELKASKAHDGRLWSPRDVLIACLRDLDAGKINPDHLIVVYHQEDEKKPNGFIEYYHANRRGFIFAIGLLDRARNLLHRQGTLE